VWYWRSCIDCLLSMHILLPRNQYTIHSRYCFMAVCYVHKCPLPPKHLSFNQSSHSSKAYRVMVQRCSLQRYRLAFKLECKVYMSGSLYELAFIISPIITNVSSCSILSMMNRNDISSLSCNVNLCSNCV